MNIKDLARICYYAQNHSRDWDWSEPSHDKQYCFEHVSFAVACFIANDTKRGCGGCGWDVVIEELVGPVLRLDQWEDVISKVVSEFGGFK